MKCPDGCTCGRHSAKTREKMRLAHLGKGVTPEAREKIRAAKAGKTCPPGCTCGKHSREEGPRRKCPEGCACGRHKARLPAEFLDGTPARTHGLRYTPEYQSWAGMKQRCSNPNVEHYALYGGRGIRVCDRWLNSFENFLADMGERPEPKALYSIDRIDCDGNYEPGNCRWATMAEQVANRRRG